MAQGNAPAASPPGNAMQRMEIGPDRVRVKNRRRRYLERHPSYFGPSLELANPLLYDSCIRRFQTTAEREAEGRAKGYSGVLEVDLQRSEAKIQALTRSESRAIVSNNRSTQGQILSEEEDELPISKEEGFDRWHYEMELRFIRGDDHDFDYDTVDDDEQLDDQAEEARAHLEKYLDTEQPTWDLKDGQQPTGETGVQDF